MRGMVKKSISLVMVLAAIALVYSMYSLISIEIGDGIAGYLTAEDRLFSVDRTSCRNRNVVFTLRNLDGVEVNTAKEIEVIRENDGTKINWDVIIPPGETGTFSDECIIDSYSVPCLYTFRSKRYGLITRVSILCS